jgi:hypothetical protein
MANEQQASKAIHISLWIAQILLAVLFLTGAVLKFQPIEKIAAMMPWAGQVPVTVVRLLGIIDLLGAMGLLLPALLHIKPILTPWTAVCALVLMLCAIVFHVSRGEAAVIPTNIIGALIAIFIAWGRFQKAPVSAK